MKTITGLLSLLLLAGCTGSKAHEQQRNIKAPWDEWYFAFTTPKALPAQVTLVKLLDTEGYGYVFETITNHRASVWENGMTKTQLAEPSSIKQNPHLK